MSDSIIQNIKIKFMKLNYKAKCSKLDYVQVLQLPAKSKIRKSIQ